LYLVTGVQTCALPILAVGGAVVDTLGIRPVYWAGGALLALAGGLGLALLGGHDFRADPDTYRRSPASSASNSRSMRSRMASRTRR
jgi:hypothetical protein